MSGKGGSSGRKEVTNAEIKIPRASSSCRGFYCEVILVAGVVKEESLPNQKCNTYNRRKMREKGKEKRRFERRIK